MKIAEIVAAIQDVTPKILAVEKEIVALAKAGKSLYPKLLEHTTLETKLDELKKIVPVDAETATLQSSAATKAAKKKAE